MLRVPLTARRAYVCVLRELKIENMQSLFSICMQGVIRYFGYFACREPGAFDGDR